MTRIISFFIALITLLVSFMPWNDNNEIQKNIEWREDFTMNTGWLYASMNYENGEDINLNESSFEQVSIPHANKILTSHGGENFQSQIDSYRFISWYRRHFTLDSSYSDKAIYINFEGVATVADVYVNGQFVGTHKGAYTSFSFDISDFVKTDGSDNVLAVRVDSTKHSDVPPEGGNVDYCLFGGIVRDVSLFVKEKIHIDNIFVTTPEIEKGKAYAKIEATVLSKLNEYKNVILEAVIKDVDGNVVATAQKNTIIKPNDKTNISFKTSEIEDVILWSIDNPYLYTTEVRIKSDEQYTDVVTTKTGFRYFEFTDTKDESAFYLNGEKMLILGINRHEQWPWIGRAVNDKYQIADADLIKASGFNAVRCSHYPQDTAFLDRCDEIGLLVFEEAPGWQHIGDENWQETYKTNIEEMIVRDRNHPSIISWGVRVNESQDNHDLYKQTNKLAKKLDETRPTHASRRHEDYENSECQEDIFCANYIYPENPRIKPFVITEHSWDWYDGNGFSTASSQQAIKFLDSFGTVLDYMYGNNYCSGGFGWSMFDYNNEVNYTKTGNTFYSGIYDIFRYPKPVSYLYKSQKNPDDEIVLHIANYWAENETQDVVVLSNCDEVELFLNEKSLGKIQPNTYINIPHPAFTFRNVEYEIGELKAVGYISGKQVAEFSRKSPQKATGIKLTPDYNTIVADGSDFTSVTVELVDENGTVLHNENEKVIISVSENGRFIGEETIALEGGHTAFLVQSKYLVTGDIDCTVKLKSDENIQGTCQISVAEYKSENEIPISSGEIGTVEPIEIISYDINDTVTSGNRNYFTYMGEWQYCYEAGCFNQDNHYSDKSGDKFTLTFSGTGARIYGSKANNHGILTVSVDGGDEQLVDCYNESRKDGEILYEIFNLPAGEHVVTIEVTVSGNIDSNGNYINIDRAVIIK